MFYSWFCILVGFYFILFYNAHYTILLLGLEIGLLGVFIYLILGVFMSTSLFGSFFFLLVMVCLGGFSISLLVSLSRGEGGDFWLSGYVF